MTANLSHSPAISAGNAASVDPAEVARFAAQAAAWWDQDGAFKPLHLLNPVRIGYILRAAADRFGRRPADPRPLDGLAVADIGCGGGLLAEPLARLGARVTAIDAAAENIAAARHHADAAGLDIDYRCQTAESLAAEGAAFDIVVAMEIVEHVADLDAFFAALGALTRPGGALCLATLNRTPKSFALAIVAAEYLLRWVPRGTHDWRRFLRPSELARLGRRHGCAVDDTTGVVYDLATGDWRESRDSAVNYMMRMGRIG